jgi:hypothetical protein
LPTLPRDALPGVLKTQHQKRRDNVPVKTNTPVATVVVNGMPHKVSVEVAALIEIQACDIEILRDKLRLIGDFAHDRSQGPTIHDDLWWVREQAYDSL